MKDHPTFLAAAARLQAAHPEAVFVCVGDGPPELASRLRQAARDMGLEGRVVWAGQQRDVTGIYNALDLLCLTSTSEAFPNVLAEAMACGLPCIATDVGDAALIMGDTGEVVPVADPAALADRVDRLLRTAPNERRRRGERARSRIVERFSLPVMLTSTERALAGVAGARAGSLAGTAPEPRLRGREHVG